MAIQKFSGILPVQILEMSGFSVANTCGNVGPYLLASVAVVCLTFIVKGESLTFGSKGIDTEEVMQIAIDKGMIALSNTMDTFFSRLETRIDSLERKIDNVLTGLIILRVGELGIQLDRVQRLNYRNLAAIDLIVDKVSLDMEESEIDTYLTKNVSTGKFNIKGFFDSVTISSSLPVQSTSKATIED